MGGLPPLQPCLPALPWAVGTQQAAPAGRGAQHSHPPGPGWPLPSFLPSSTPLAVLPAASPRSRPSWSRTRGRGCRCAPGGCRWADQGSRCTWGGSHRVGSMRGSAACPPPPPHLLVSGFGTGGTPAPHTPPAPLPCWPSSAGGPHHQFPRTALCLQHIALKTDDIFSTMRAMRARSGLGGFEFMPRPSGGFRFYGLGLGGFEFMPRPSGGWLGRCCCREGGREGAGAAGPTCLCLPARMAV